VDRIRIRNASVKDVAATAGVSLGTVSNVLNRPGLVSSATRERVERAMADLGFVRNESARQLRAGQSRTLAYVMLDASNPFFTDVARGIEDAAELAELSLFLCNSDNRADREETHLALLQEQRVQGILVTPVGLGGKGIEDLTRRGTPVVLLDRGAGRRSLCSVVVDDHVGGQIAAAHLIERGHRHIAFVGGPMEMPQVTDRLDGARKIIEAAGAVLDVIETPALSVAAGRAAAARIPGAASAVFCANDLLALGVLQAVTRAGMSVPRDLAIVGYDDIEFAAAAAVPLTSVRQPRHQLGRVAAELLFEEIEHGARHGHRQVVFQPELVVRASSDRDLALPSAHVVV
jgi:LacI family transcriptional regulator